MKEVVYVLDNVIFFKGSIDYFKFLPRKGEQVQHLRTLYSVMGVVHDYNTGVVKVYVCKV